MIYLGVGAIVVGLLVALQPFSDVLDALVPDTIVMPIAGGITVLTGLALIVKTGGG